MSLEPGARLGAYEVVGRLGAGAMGEVYRARDRRLDREVALKILPPEFASNADRGRRFEQESRAAGALNHPNIVAVYDVGEQDGVSYIVSELVEGESLRSLMARGPVAPRRALELAAQIADGLAAAHAAGVVHRDLKPENVMLTRDGRAKILDFGLARYQPARGEGTMTMTQPGMVMGTAGYMSPEQVMAGPSEAPADIFALGVIVQEMLTGHLPFERATTVETMSAILRDDPRPVPENISAAIRQVILHCLEKEPARRFQSASDLAFNLRAAAGPVSAIAPSPVAAGRPRFRLAPSLAVVALLGLAVAGGEAILLLRRPAGADLASYRFTPLATDSQLQAYPVWSPDGKNVVYVRGVDGGEDFIMVRNLDALVPEVAARANNPRSFSWSPDGTRVFFVAEGGIWSVSRGGGEKQSVLKGDFASATLSPDGKALVYWLSLGEHGKTEPKIWVSSPPGSTPRKYEPVVFEGEGSFLPVHMRFSPDGAEILASVATGTGPQMWLLPFPDGTAAHGKPRRILTEFLAHTEQPPYMSWMPDSRRVVLDYTPASQAVQLWMADTRGETMRPITAGEDRRDSPGVSPDGSRIAFDSSEYHHEIVEIPVVGGPPRPLVATSRNQLFPAWAPNGNTFAFVTDRSGQREIWLKSVAEGWERPLVTERDFPEDHTHWLLTPAISPDGTRIAYGRVSNKRAGELWVSPVSGGSPLRVTSGTGYEIAPSWSPDGKWLAYFSTDGGLMKIRVGASEPAVFLGFSSGCENAPQWSPDGRWIACATGQGVGLVSPDGKDRKTLKTRTAFIAWSRDGKQIYALGRVEGGKWRLGAIDAASGAEKIIQEYGPETRFSTAFNLSFPMSLSPDGKSLATTVLKARSDIWVLEGFGK